MTDEYFWRFIKDAEDRYKEGEQEHGIFDPKNDKRDLLGEIYEEILDAYNYIGMYILQIQTQRPEQNNFEFCRRMNFCRALLIEIGKEILSIKKKK